jgi:ectoine hydroxylase-related dioxygenase (phytanoyl-CoA dioxygenase family)
VVKDSRHGPSPPPPLARRTPGAVTYPRATDDQRAAYRDHGFLVVADAIPATDLDELEGHLDKIIAAPSKLAFDWAWSEDEAKDDRSFRIIQSSPSLVWPEIADARFRAWAVEFASDLVGRPVEFWYDQFLAKPPERSVPTSWHQDEGYWGRNVDDRGITCWIPLQDVDESNGCMHFIDRGHVEGVLEHRRVEGVQSDLLVCEPDVERTVPCPIARGSVTFHHSKMPHMTTANRSAAYRKAVSQHMRVVGTEGEGDHYPWKVYVDQISGTTFVPPTR